MKAEFEELSGEIKKGSNAALQTRLNRNGLLRVYPDRLPASAPQAEEGEAA